MLLDALTNLWNGKRTPTAKDYDRANAVFFYDGIENAGFGEHSTITDQWFDLAGGAGNASIINTVNWGDDCLKCLTATFARSSSLAFCNTVLSGTYTFEILVKTEPLGISNGGIVGAGDNSERIFWIWERNTSYGYTEFIDDIATAQGKWGRPATTRHHPLILLQFSVTPSASVLMINGEVVQRRGALTTASYTATGFDIGRIRVNTGTTGYIGNDSICRCMLHSRAFTEAELRNQYAIDKARFMPKMVQATFVDDSYWDTYGTAQTLSGGSRCENFIPVQPSSTVTFNFGAKPNGTTLYMIQYNSNKERVNSTHNGNSVARTVTIPSNCNYIRFSCETAKKDAVYVHDDTNGLYLMCDGKVVV